MRISLRLHPNVELDVSLSQRCYHRVSQIVIWWPKRQSRDWRPLLHFRPDRILHGLAFSKEIGDAAEIGRFKGTALSLDPEPLHYHVEHVWTQKIQEVEYLRIFNAPFLQLSVCLYIGCHERRRRNAKHIESELFFVHQLWPGNTHKLDADAHETDIVDIRCDIGARPGEANPGPKCLTLCVNAVPELRRQIVVHNVLAPHNTVRFCVSTSLKSSRFPKPFHLLLKTRDDRVKKLFFTREQPFLGNFEALVWPVRVNQCGNPARNMITKQQVEC